MADSDNYDILPTAGALTGTETIPCREQNSNKKTTVAEVATYVASASLPLTGSFAGSITGLTSEVFTPTIVTASAAFPATSYLQLNHATVPILMTALTPTVGLFLVISQKDAGTAGHTVTTAGTFDGTNNTATFNAANETLVLFGVSSTRWAIVSNVGAVGLSAV